MKPCVSHFVLLVLCPLMSIAQPPRKVATDAFMITRMAAKFHTQPRTLDQGFSSDFYGQIMNELDDQHFLFWKGDLLRLEPFRLRLSEQLLGQKTDFLDLLTRIYGDRIREADSLIERLSSIPLTSNPLRNNVADTLAPDNVLGMRSRLAALFGTAVKDYVQIDLDSGRKGTETAERKRVGNTFRRAIDRLTQSPGGITQALDLTYLNALAACYDPHTSFFSTTEKEQFEQELGNGHYIFGFSMKEQGTGVIIDRIQPGTPAFRAGIFSTGDQLVSVQWAGKEPIDLTDASLDEVNDVLDASNHDEATIKVRKEDGSIRQVSLVKQKDSNTETDGYKVKGWLMKGAASVGYISLPSFYTDWDNASGAKYGCAEDVAKKILELKKQHIGALILDLRYNGGGSLDEAVELAGLFIDAGPVAQARDRDEKPYVLKDMNRGTVFDGPLILLVNGYSASATEVIAACLQDYNRALIVGNPTYGKATAQVVLPLDTNITIEDQSTGTPTDGYLKLTVSRLYRVTGLSVQATGVQPDIPLPPPPGAVFHRESEEPFALHPNSVAPDKYVRPYPPLPKPALQVLAAKWTAEGLFSDSTGKGPARKASFTMDMPADERAFTLLYPVLQSTDEQMSAALLQDPYLEMAFRLACQMITYSNP